MADGPRKLRETLDLLSSIEDRSERIQLLIDVSRRYRPVPESLARPPYPPEHRVPGCESEAYVWAEEAEDGTLRFHFAVLNPQGISAMALAVILQEGLAGAAPEDAALVSPEIVYSIFGRELSMGKSMGLTGVVRMVAALAREKAAARGEAGRTADPA